MMIIIVKSIIRKKNILIILLQAGSSLYTVWDTIRDAGK